MVAADKLPRYTTFMKKFKSYLLIAIFYLLFSPLAVYAVNPNPSCTDPTVADFGLRCTAEEAGLKPQGDEPAIGSVAALGGRLAGYLLSFVGVIFFALTMYGGILWMTARGDSEQVKKAQELIRSAVIGLVVVFLSYAVTNFVITNLLSTTR